MANTLVDIHMFVEFIPQNNEFQPQSWRKLYSNLKVKCSCIHRGPESIECIILWSAPNNGFTVCCLLNLKTLNSVPHPFPCCLHFNCSAMPRNHFRWSPFNVRKRSGLFIASHICHSALKILLTDQLQSSLLTWWKRNPTILFEHLHISWKTKK